MPNKAARHSKFRPDSRYFARILVVSLLLACVGHARADDRSPQNSLANAAIATNPPSSELLATLPGTRLPSLGNVLVDHGDPKAGGTQFPDFQNLVVGDLPAAIRTIAATLKQPRYSVSFVHPLVIRFENDPTSQEGEGHQQDLPSDQGWAQSLTMNHALWDQCPSKPLLHSLETHELTHAVLHDLLTDGKETPIPQWFDEGVATYVAGEPSLSIAVDASYYHFGPTYPPESLKCSLASSGNLSGAMVNDCYVYFYFAVRFLEEKKAGALPKVIADLKAGDRLEQAVQKETGLDWGAYLIGVADYVDTQFHSMSFTKRLTGRNWWWYARWCRG